MDKNLHNEVDELFSSGLGDLNEKPSAAVWDAIESGLDKRDLADAKAKNRKLKRLSLLLLLLLTSSVLIIYFEKQKKQGNALVKNQDSRKQQGLVPFTKEKEESSPEKMIPGNAENRAEPAVKNEPAKDNTASAVTDAGNTGAPATEKQTGTSLNKRNNQPELKPGNNKKAVIASVNTKDADEKNPSLVITGNNPVKRKSVITGKEKEEKAALVKGKPAADADQGHLVKNKPERIITQPDISSVSTSEKESWLDAITSLSKPVTAGRTAHDVTFRNTGIPVNAQPVTASLPKTKIKRPGISLSLSPYYTHHQFESEVREGRREHREDDREEIMEREEKSGNNIAGTIGLLVSAQLSKKISVQAGAGVYTIDNTISNQKVYAREHPRDGRQEEDFKFNCTAGTVYFNSKLVNTNPVAGDSLQALASSSRLQYIEIPVSVRYHFLTKGKLSLFATTGVTGNLLAKSNVSATITDGTLKENVSATTIDGLKKTYFSAGIGAGAEYQLAKGVAVYFIPSKTFALGAINKNAPVNTSLNAINLNAGIRVNIGKK